MKLTLKIFMNISAKIKNIDFSNYLTNWKYYDISNKLVAGMMKDEKACFAIE